jgi:translation initiation factor 5
MSKMINIDRDIIDPYYRYKMPKINGLNKGRGNGCKTMIINLDDVAKSLNREPYEILKFIGYSTGSQTSITKDSEYILNGFIQDEDLLKYLYIYIEMFVICFTCRNPETNYKIRSKVVNTKCSACGAMNELNEHKLLNYIKKKLNK